MLKLFNDFFNVIQRGMCMIEGDVVTGSRKIDKTPMLHL